MSREFIMSNESNKDNPESQIEFQSPTKTLQLIFRRKDSLDSSDSRNSIGSGEYSRRSLSPSRSPFNHANPPKRGSMASGRIRSLFPMLNASRSSVVSDVTQNSVLQSFEQIRRSLAPADSDIPSVKDFADTSEEGDESSSDVYSESIESILEEYSDDGEPKNKHVFLFKEHFDERSMRSMNRQRNSRIVSDDSTRDISHGNLTDIPNESLRDFHSSSQEHSSQFHNTSDSNKYTTATTTFSSSDPKFDTTRNDNTNVSDRRYNVTNSTGDSQLSERPISDLRPFSDRYSGSISERPLSDRPDRESAMSLTSGELLNKLNRSLSNISDKSEEGEKQEALIAYRVSNNKSPKLIQIPSPRPLEPVHYHDSDISSNSSIGSIEPGKEFATNLKKHAVLPSFGISRRPPPEAPVTDSLLKYNQHEDMTSPRTVISGFPTLTSPIHSNVSSPFYSDNENSAFGADYEKGGLMTPRLQVYSNAYFAMLMILGLLLPPVYFLVPLGIFDKLKSSKNYYTGVYYRLQYLVDNRRVIKFKRIHKLISFVIGLIWFAIILAMIGVGFGLSQ